MFAKFVGVSPETARLIERHRRSEDEPEDAIIRRVFTAAGQPNAKFNGPEKRPPDRLDLGQGVVLDEGERIYLYLDKSSEGAKSCHGFAEVKGGRLFVEGKPIQPSHGSVITPAMRHFQEKVGHRNEKGELISLSAFRQWHAVRQGKRVPLETLKDPALARRRNRSKIEISLEDLEL